MASHGFFTAEKLFQMLFGLLWKVSTRPFSDFLGLEAADLPHQVEVFFKPAALPAHDEMEPGTEFVVPGQAAVHGIGHLSRYVITV